MELRFGCTSVIAYVVAYVMAYVNTYVIAYVVAYVVACDLAYVITYIVTYPYAWTVNFEICLELQLRTYQPPIPKTSQASAWSYKYIGRCMFKTEGSLTGFGKNFRRLNG